MKGIRSLVGYVALIAATGTLGLPGAVRPACANETVAESAEATSPSANEESAALSEIIVTAQKREENIQKVPVSITALGTEALESRQVDDITDLQRYVPSMEVGQLYGANLITLRGISTGQTGGWEDPSIATHLNGIYQARGQSLSVALIDLDRVEVLSGPQGTLYGRNATGGAVNYITKGPASAFESEVTGTVANYDRYGIKGYVSAPITDKLGVRVAALFDDQIKGFTENLLANAPNNRLEATRSAGGHVDLRYQASESLQLDLDAIYVNTKGSTIFSGFGIAPGQSFVAPGAALAPQTFTPHQVYSELPAYLNSEHTQIGFTANWNISPTVNLKSITAYQQFKEPMSIDLDASQFVLSEVNQTNKTSTYTQELDLTTHMFSDRLTSIYGAFYFNDHLSMPAEANLLYYWNGVLSSKSAAAFTDQTFNLTSRLRLTAGIRYTKDQKNATQSFTIPSFALTLCDALHSSADSSNWSPKFGAQFDVADGIMAYANWQRGYKAGGIVNNTCANAYQPEGIKGPEVGIKSELFDRRLRLNIAGYYYNYSNLQVQKSFGAIGYKIVNAASATLKGVEISGQAALTDKLHADLAANVQSAKYDSFQGCNAADFYGACSATDTRTVGVLTSAGGQDSNLAGNWLNRAPPYTVNVGLQYKFAMPDGGALVVRGESYFSGTVHLDEFGSALATQSAYNIQNVYATYTLGGGRLLVRGFVKNVGDTNYKISNYFNVGAEFTGNWGPPRTYGGEITVRF